MSLTYRKAVKNIRKVYQEVPEEIKATNTEWYSEVNGFAQEIADRHGLPLRAVCHTIAAISPNVKWWTNKRDAAALIEANLSGASIDSISVSTYTKFKRKAWEIVERAKGGLDYDGILSGPKVTAFAYNIEFPECNKEVTIDYHAFSIAAGVRYTAKNLPNIRVGEFAVCKRAYVQVAKEVGLKPHQVQAITWTWWRMSK